MINELLNQLKWAYTNPSCMEREKAKGYYDAIKDLQQENQRLKEDIKAYEQERNNLINSIPFKQNKRLESKINKTKEAIDELLIFNDDNGITSGIGNVKEELKFYLSDYDTLEEFRKSEKGDNNEC